MIRATILALACALAALLGSGCGDRPNPAIADFLANERSFTDNYEQYTSVTRVVETHAENGQTQQVVIMNHDQSVPDPYAALLFVIQDGTVIRVYQYMTDPNAPNGLVVSLPIDVNDTMSGDWQEIW